MISKKPIGLGLFAVVVAMLAMAFAASTASATRITPPNTVIKATLVAETTSKFMPKNAYAGTSIQCETSTATGTTPTQEEAEAQNNTNRTGVGARSEGPGSVIMDVTPTFTNCAVYAWNGAEWVKTGTEATVAVNGNWTFAADWITSTAIPVVIGVPSNGAVITVGEVCEITVSNGRASAVMGRWTNPAGEASAMMRIDGQIEFASPEACGGVTPAQFEGEYEVKTEAGGNVEITE